MIPRLLIVEDDPELQELYVTMLEGLECEIVPAYDGQEALAKIDDARPDLLILDILLDELMGDALFQQLRQDPRYARLPVVVISVLSAHRCRELFDFDDIVVFLRKPFRREQLLEAVRAGLSI
ncbi:MAG: response regulator [Anaerolineae bacterium]